MVRPRAYRSVFGIADFKFRIPDSFWNLESEIAEGDVAAQLSCPKNTFEEYRGREQSRPFLFLEV